MLGVTCRNPQTPSWWWVFWGEGRDQDWKRMRISGFFFFFQTKYLNF